MGPWEYKFLVNQSAKDLEKEANDLGRAGWELVSAVPTPSASGPSLVLFLKRAPA